MSTSSYFNAKWDRQSAREVWDRINDRSMPKSRCTTKIIKLILLLHDTDFNSIDGAKVVFKSKPLGAGVSQVWMEREK